MYEMCKYKYNNECVSHTKKYFKYIYIYIMPIYINFFSQYAHTHQFKFLKTYNENVLIKPLIIE